MDSTDAYILTQRDKLLKSICKSSFFSDINKKTKFKEMELLTEETNLVLLHFSKLATLLQSLE